MSNLKSGNAREDVNAVEISAEGESFPLMGGKGGLGNNQCHGRIGRMVRREPDSGKAAGPTYREQEARIADSLLRR